MRDSYHAIMARFDQLEYKLESLIDKLIVEVNNGNKQVYEKTTLDRARAQLKEL